MKTMPDFDQWAAQLVDNQPLAARYKIFLAEELKTVFEMGRAYERYEVQLQSVFDVGNLTGRYGDK